MKVPMILVISLISLLMVPADSDPSRLWVRVGEFSETPWVGQQVLVPVIVGLSQRPSGTPQFRVPEVPGGILLAVPGPVYGSEKRDGIEFYTALALG